MRSRSRSGHILTKRELDILVMTELGGEYLDSIQNAQRETAGAKWSARNYDQTRKEIDLPPRSVS